MPAPAWLLQRFFSRESGAWLRRADDADERARIDWTADWLAAHVTLPGPIVDLGCGTGNFARALARRGYDVVGLDYSPGMLAKAEAAAQAAGLENLRFERADLNRPLDLPAGSFAGAICFFAIQYVGDPGSLIAEIRRVLRPGGYVLLAAPATDWCPTGVGPRPRRHRRVRRCVSRIPGVLHRFTDDQVRTALADSGFSVVEYRRYPGGHGFLARAEVSP